MRGSRAFGLIVVVVAAVVLYAYRDTVFPGDSAGRQEVASVPGQTPRAATPPEREAETPDVPEIRAGSTAAPGHGRTDAAGEEATPPPVGDRDAASPPGAERAASGSGDTDVPPAATDALEEEAARDFIETLTETEPKPIPIEQADHFVLPEQVISLASRQVVELVSPRDIVADPGLGPDSPITVVKEIPQIEIMTPERIIAESGGDLEQRLKILEEEEVREVTVGTALAKHAASPGEPISVVKLAEYLEPTTPRRLQREGAGDWDTMIRVIREPYRLESTTVAELLAGIEDVEPDSVFYVRTVRPSDVQGVWGIIHDGLIKNFARGMAVRRGEETNTYKVEIPRYADELLEDRSSSFLGRLIDQKARQSTVYNFELGRMTRNPHLIVPGSEILIVNFSAGELVNIYKHFLSRRG